MDPNEYIQVAKNYYAKWDEWAKLSTSARHLELCVCASNRRSLLMFTGQSVCAAHDIPRLTPFEMRPNCISEIHRRTDLIHWHYEQRDPDATHARRILCARTSRSICTLAKTDTPDSLLVSINHCLYKRLFTREQILTELDMHPHIQGCNILERLMAFATPKCESPLETIAAIALYKAGFVMPQQQVNIYSGRKRIGRVDMIWKLRRRNVILELDGRLKYKQADDLFAEKRREDAIRAEGYMVLRADWDDVHNGQLAKLLAEQKIPMRRNFGLKFP
ncbi:MAG: hypothetical protein LBN12_05150 [Clostridiales Family XIII bacterium]|jgi:very-short-patch-repair endonuclease|nr:hypothetical protein [Clostridiales Family XIII bacterium]